MGKVNIRFPNRVKYKKELQESLDTWEKKSSEEVAALDRMFQRGAQDWILMWDIIKKVEREYNINLRGLVREEIWRSSYKTGQNLAKKYKNHVLKDLYNAFLGFFEGLCKYEWFEFNDVILEVWCHECPNIRHFKEAGWTDEQIKETAPYFCLQDIGIMTGFNEQNEVFIQPRLLMSGHSHCSFRVEAHYPLIEWTGGKTPPAPIWF